MESSNNVIQGILLYLNKHGYSENKEKILSQLAEKIKAGNLFAVITSGVVLSDEEKNRIIKYLSGKYSKNIKYEFIIEPKILGGLKIKIGDTLVDYSFLGMLENINNSL